MRPLKQKEVEIFLKLYEKFYNECVENLIVPVPELNIGIKGIYPFMNALAITKEEREEVLKKIKT